MYCFILHVYGFIFVSGFAAYTFLFRNLSFVSTSIYKLFCDRRLCLFDHRLNFKIHCKIKCKCDLVLLLKWLGFYGEAYETVKKVSCGFISHTHYSVTVFSFPFHTFPCIVYTFVIWCRTNSPPVSWKHFSNRCQSCGSAIHCAFQGQKRTLNPTLSIQVAPRGGRGRNKETEAASCLKLQNNKWKHQRLFPCSCFIYHSK